MPSRCHWMVPPFLAVLFLCSSFSYRQALEPRDFAFPRDHFSHPGFRTEWWYYTGHLSAEGGKSYGYQVTFFRFGLRDRQDQEADRSPHFTDLYMAHFALSDIDAQSFTYRDRVNRGYGGKAGAREDRYLVWNEGWKVEMRNGKHEITIHDGDRILELSLTAEKPPVLHGLYGLSRKGEAAGRASYYYSLTRMKTRGTLQESGRREKVQGQSWMDHEFGSDQLGEDQVGWDWFSLQLDNNREVMLYLMRRKDGSMDPVSSGTLVDESGKARGLSRDSFRVEALGQWSSPRSGATYPMGWNIRIPSEGAELEVVPFFPQQELDTRKSTRVTYWEGAVRVRGRYLDKPVAGLGYVELTGYGERLRF